MKKILIHTYQLKAIENGMRLCSNLLDAKAKNTYLSRQIVKAHDFCKEVLKSDEGVDEWIIAKDRLPDSQRIVLVKTDKDSSSTAYCHGKKSGFITYGEYAYKEFGEITHWREID